MLRRSGTLLILIGAGLMAWPALTWGYGRYWQERLSAGWREPVMAPPAGVVGAAHPASDAPEAFARLTIERIGLDAMVVAGTDALSLCRGPGHVARTVRPGESGNCAIAGHRDGWFARLDEVRPGDPVWIETFGCAYLYLVEEQRVVAPDRGDLLETGPYPTLTLVTCTGPGYPNSHQRLLVFCKLQAVRAF